MTSTIEASSTWSVACGHFGFLKPSFVAVRSRRGKPKGSVIGSFA
jgi:hypothetical protein